MRRWVSGVAAVIALGAVTGSADAASLYSGPGPRPGPSILYAKPATAPQLRNHGTWHAKPLLVSGASGYRKGEFLYQDYLYDDTGAKGVFGTSDPKAQATFARFNGTYSYPTDPAYAQNAADLVELRVKPLRGATAVRLTYNSMTDPGLVATTIAIGDSPTPLPMPHGANVVAPAQLFLTVHGTEADLVDAADGQSVSPAPEVKVSTGRHQVEVRVPHAAWNPKSKRVRMAAGSGLWDAASGSYLIPAADADADTPGGAGTLAHPAAFFNVAFRFAEPQPNVGDTASIFTDPKWWRDDAQADALAAGDISGFSTKVDFKKLRRGVTDLMRGRPGGVPSSGPMDRIASSHFDFGQGADWAKSCSGHDDCSSQLLGRLLPYAIYVPAKPQPKRGYGLTLLLHSLGANYNQFLGSRNQSQIGDRDGGSIVITPSGRGTDGWYYGAAGADTFEVWADVARRYRLDPRYAAISGYSMGGYGTYKFATQYPDLFAAGQPVVGPPGQGVWVPPNNPVPGGAASNTNRMLASVRNVPFLIWDGVEDELVPFAGASAQAQTFDDLGYRYAFDAFPTAEHLTFAANDSYQPAADFLAHQRVVRNPAHITYVVNPTMDFADRGTVADHAYWLSGLRLRDGGGNAPLGEVDAISRGFGRTDPVAGPTQTSAGTLPPGNLGSLAYTERSRTWGPAGSEPKRDTLTLDLTNVATVKVDPKRAKLSCRPQLDVITDGPATVKLAGCHRKLSFGS